MPRPVATAEHIDHAIHIVIQPQLLVVPHDQRPVARKILQSWLVWMVTNLIYVGLYLASALYLTLGLYAAYLALAVAGYIAWNRSLRSAPESI